jgi:hypothetical protein
MRAFVVFSAVLALASPARAQDEEPKPDPEPPVEGGAPLPPDETAAPAPPDEYDQAFEALMRGDRDEARRLLEIVAARGEGDPWGKRAAELLLALSGQPKSSGSRLEQKSSTARAELALFQTLNGAFAGLMACGAGGCFDSSSAVPAVLLAVGGAGAGLAGSLLATRNGIHPGHTQLVNSGTVWGIWNSIALLAILDVDDLETIMGGLLAGSAGGSALGMALWPVLRPTSGQVATTNTVAAWSLALTSFAQGAFFDELDLDADELFTTMLIVSDAGLVAGGFLARRFPASRGRMLMIDAGGVVGSLAGAGTAVLIQGDDIERETFFRAMLPGAAIGLGAAFFLTRNWDGPDVPVSTAFVPVHGGGGMAVVSGSF